MLTAPLPRYLLHCSLKGHRQKQQQQESAKPKHSSYQVWCTEELFWEACGHQQSAHTVLFQLDITVTDSGATGKTQAARIVTIKTKL